MSEPNYTLGQPHCAADDAVHASWRATSPCAPRKYAHSRSESRRWWLALAGAISALAGCNRSPTRELVGTVTYQGQPLVDARLVFVDESGLRTAMAVSDATGRYRTFTYLSSTEILPGARPGEYTLIVDKRTEGPKTGEVTDRIFELAQYSEAEARRYMRERAVRDLWPDGVPDGWPSGYIPGVIMPPEFGPNDREAERRFWELLEGKSLVPEKYTSPQTSGLRASVPPGSEPLTLNFNLGDDPD